MLVRVHVQFFMRNIHQIRFYSVAVITSGSDPSFFTEACLDCPGDPGSIPGRTYKQCSALKLLFSVDSGRFGVFLNFLQFFVSNLFLRRQHGKISIGDR